MQKDDRDRDLFEQFMLEAVEEAAKAESLEEVPVGAVVVLDGRIVGRGFNRPISAKDPTAHAEIIALREAARSVDNYRLVDAQLFVTIEPCPMCAGACLHARIRTLVFGARDSKAGAVRSHHRLLDAPQNNHKIEIVEGILEEACREKIQSFFQKKRGNQDVDR